MKEISPKGPRTSFRRPDGTRHHAGRLRAGRLLIMPSAAAGQGCTTCRCPSVPNHEVCEVSCGREGRLRLPGAQATALEHGRGRSPSSCSTTPPIAGRRWRDAIVESDPSAGSGCTTASRHASATERRQGEGKRRGQGRLHQEELSVPVPEVDDLQDYNRGLAETLDAHSEKRLHYEKGLSWADLFQADKAHLLAYLPKSPSTSSSGRRARPTATEGSRWTAAIATWRHPHSHVFRSRWACAPSRR